MSSTEITVNLPTERKHQDVTRKLVIAGVVGAVVVLAGCGTTKTVFVHAAPPATSPARQAATTRPPAVPAAAQLAATNERLFADAMAASVPDVPSQVIAGPVMAAYVSYEHAQGEANNATGNPASDYGVTAIGGGFTLCDQSGSGQCITLSQFTTNSRGQVTGVSVNGQPVNGRIATASSASSGGLKISDVTALRVANTSGTVVEVGFKLTDTSYQDPNSFPSLLASLNGAQDVVSDDALPSNLAPGETVYAVAGFAASSPSGEFCLLPNGGNTPQLPCTRLHMP